MAGGRGARMSRSGGPREKLLIRHRGRPVVLGVLDALRGSGSVSAVYAATSPHAPAAAAALRRAGAGIVETAGAGYSADLAAAVSELARRGLDGPALVVPGDMPRLTAAAVRMLASEYAASGGAAGRAGGPSPPAWTCFVAPARRAPAAAAGAPRPAYAAPGGGAFYTGLSVVELGRAAGLQAPGGGAGRGERYIVLRDPLLAASYNVAGDIDRVRRMDACRPARARRGAPAPGGAAAGLGHGL